PDDARVRVRAPQRVAPHHAGRLQVARVRELPGDLRDSVLTRDNLADAAELELDVHVPAANRTASKIFASPVQRQRWPDRASRISSPFGLALCASRSTAATTRPGVQDPH